MKKKIKLYLRSLLKYGSNVKSGDTLIVIMPEFNQDIIDNFLELKDEFGIKKIIFKVKNYKELFYLLSEIELEDVSKYVSAINIESNYMDTKFIIFEDDSFSKYKNLLSSSQKLAQKYNRYLSIDKYLNSKFYDLYSNCYCTLGVCSTKEWAKVLFGSGKFLDELWNDLFKIVPQSDEDAKVILDRLRYLSDYLNTLKIKELYFNNAIGTDLKIGLSKHSIWANNFENTMSNQAGFVYNYPSYEIYTVPDMYLAEGKIRITKPTSLYGMKVNCGEVSFRDGMVIFADTDNVNWNKTVLDGINKLQRIGEIALVSSESLVAKVGRNFKNLLLDENSLCHLALGNSLNECNDLINKFDKERYHFYESLFHQDIVFGDDTINVECKSFDGKKKVLISEGKWNI